MTLTQAGRIGEAALRKVHPVGFGGCRQCRISADEQQAATGTGRFAQPPRRLRRIGGSEGPEHDDGPGWQAGDDRRRVGRALRVGEEEQRRLPPPGREG